MRRLVVVKAVKRETKKPYSKPSQTVYDTVRAPKDPVAPDRDEATRGFGTDTRPSGCPRPMRRGWLRRNRLTTTLPYTIRLCGRLWLTPSHNQAYFFGEVLRAEALGLKREDRPAAFAGRSESVFWIFCWWDTTRAYTGEYPIPLACSLNTAGRSHRKGIRKCGRGKSGHLRGKPV